MSSHFNFHFKIYHIILGLIDNDNEFRSQSLIGLLGKKVL